jgi:SAM-dependent methyltransferase
MPEGFAAIDFARLWEWRSRDHQDDVAYYDRHLKPGIRVTEMGSGVGRLVPVLAAHGRIYTGVESDAGMLMRAWDRHAGLPDALKERVTFLRGTLSSIRLPAAQHAIVVSYNGLHALPGPHARARAIGHMAGLLAPGGQLLIDSTTLDPVYAPNHLHREFAGDGGIQVFEYREDRWDAELHRQVSQLTYQMRGGDGEPVRQVKRELVTYAYDTDELIDLLVTAGLRVVALHAGYRDKRPDPAWRGQYQCIAVQDR